jgi:hypothetical protein
MGQRFARRHSRGQCVQVGVACLRHGSHSSIRTRQCSSVKPGAPASLCSSGLERVEAGWRLLIHSTDQILGA